MWKTVSIFLVSVALITGIAVRVYSTPTSPNPEIQIHYFELTVSPAEVCANIGERIEIRGFGSFSLHYRPPRIGRNPKTGDAVTVASKYVPHFKPGKEMRERVNESMTRVEITH